jgi:hypothetical protein
MRLVERGFLRETRVREEELVSMMGNSFVYMTEAYVV